MKNLMQEYILNSLDYGSINPLLQLAIDAIRDNDHDFAMQLVMAAKDLSLNENDYSHCETILYAMSLPKDRAMIAATNFIYYLVMGIKKLN